jgi:hypothetical protein
MTNEMQQNLTPTTPKILDGQSQLVYADRMLQVSFGNGTSKILFGVETLEKETYVPTATVVIPTAALLDGVDFIIQMIDVNDDVKKTLTAALDTVKERIEKGPTKKK